MTEQSNAELITEVNEKLAAHQWTSDWGVEMLAGILAERLEAADQRAAEYAAVVEKVRATLPLSNPELIEAGYAVPAEDLIDILTTAPADALREHDAELIEKLATEAGYSLVHHEEAVAFLRREARQRREEQS